MADSRAKDDYQPSTRGPSRKPTARTACLPPFQIGRNGLPVVPGRRESITLSAQDTEVLCVVRVSASCTDADRLQATQSPPSPANRRNPYGNGGAGQVGGMNDPARPRLTLIQGGRDAMERELLHLCIFGPTEAFRSAMDALNPRSRLTRVQPVHSATPPASASLTGLAHDEHSCQ